VLVVVRARQTGLAFLVPGQSHGQTRESGGAEAPAETACATHSNVRPEGCPGPETLACGRHLCGTPALAAALREQPCGRSDYSAVDVPHGDLSAIDMPPCQSKGTSCQS